MKFLDAANHYARSAVGFAVLPLRAGTKVPLVARGVKDATRDLETIGAWWREWPDANIGIAIPDGLRVLDIDPKNLGNDSLDAMVEAHGALPTTIAQRTGSSGAHYLFAVPRGIQTRTKLIELPGAEILGGVDELGRPTRYIVGAPSMVPLNAKGHRNPNGGQYAWISRRGTPIAPMPAWLLELATEELARTPSPAPASAPSAPDAVERARRYLEKVGPAISGANGHGHTFIVAQKLVRGFGLSDGDAFALLKSWNETCAPPWSDFDLRRKIQQARARGHMEPGALLERRRA